MSDRDWSSDVCSSDLPHQEHEADPLVPQVEALLVAVQDDDHRRDDSEDRSEEHTSELQSRSDLVCRLLLEKKKREIEIAQQGNGALVIGDDPTRTSVV